jgi:opacity protein-like surface antigen
MNMKKFHMFFAVAATMIASNISHAASTTTPILSNDEYGVGQGDIETNFSINPQVIRGSGGGTERLSMRLGGNYFLDDIWAPGLDININAGGGSSIRFLPNVKAYFQNGSRLLPYVQVGFGYARELGNNFAAFSVGPGVNYMLSNSVAIGAQLRYDLGAGSQTLHVISMPVQFAIYFKY